MQKVRTRNHSKLISELASLRKGHGISPTKMASCTVLREIVARTAGADANSITNSQIHNLLLMEISKLPHTDVTRALRFAFSLTKETKSLNTLLKRRQALARIISKHPDTVIRYENQAINDLAHHLEDLKVPAGLSREPNNAIPRRDSSHAIMRETAILNLSGLLPVADRAAELIGYLEQSQRPFLETSIDLRLLPSGRGKDWYRFELKYSFTGIRNTFRLAVVVDSEDGERLLARGLIDEFHNININESIDPAQEIRGIINNSRFIAHNHEANSQKRFRLQELAAPQADSLLRSVGEPLKAQCRFLEVSLPIEWQSENVTYEYRSALNLRDDIHYAYWYAPNMMYAKKLVFDYSQFPDADKWNFIPMPFLGNPAGESIRHEHSFVVHPNSWIMPGHGIALVWEAKS